MEGGDYPTVLPRLVVVYLSHTIKVKFSANVILVQYVVAFSCL